MIGYSKEYFEWQKNLGELGGLYDTFKYLPYVKKDSFVLDFGCGGGYILKSLNVPNSFGVEPNEVARKECISKGLKVSESLDYFEFNTFDLIYSNHVFEHLDSPLETAIKLGSYLKDQGVLIITVPNECSVKYVPNNIDQHIYTWSEINLGNLLYRAGFEILEVKSVKFRWTPRFTWIHKLFGISVFKIFCFINSIIHLDRKEVMAVVRKVNPKN
jgi:SAM-dependent methyltransferase